MKTMEEQISLPVTLPVDNPTTSYWQDPPDAEVADFKNAETVPETADTVVIGSGITGVSVALGLLNKDEKEKVVMLEARQAVSGATGRNGGHTKTASYRTFLTNLASLGVSDAVKIARLEYNNMKATQSFIRTHNIPCDLVCCDTVDVIYDQDQWNKALKSIEAMRKYMPDDLNGAAKYRIWSSDEAVELFHCKGEKPFGAVGYEAGSLSAYKFGIGILKMCLKKGLNLFTNTPAKALRKDANGMWLVETSRGTIRAKRVVLATNGYTGYIHKKFHKVIVPLRGQITAHRPGSNMPPEGLQTTYSFIYNMGYEYMIPRPNGSTFAGDIVIGGGLTKAPDEGTGQYGTCDDTAICPEISTYLHETTPRFFGKSWGSDHPEGRVRKEWTGIMGYSCDGLPFVGEVPREKGLWISASFQGHGMVLCLLCARALVENMIANKEKVQTADLDSWFPKSFWITEDRMKKTFKGKLHEMSTDLAAKL
ncbi:FAD dependent oxidoreductase [Xylogone sp. PMI_703]|nr:FAD dependent oxidoreductase [Xylogone sp. PMI_703]